MTDPMRSDLATDPKRLKGDLRMIRQAVHNGWKTPPEIKQAIIMRLRAMVETNQTGDDSETLDLNTLLRVAETVCKLDKSDMDWLRLQLDAGKAEQPEEIRVTIVREGA